MKQENVNQLIVKSSEATIQSLQRKVVDMARRLRDSAQVCSRCGYVIIQDGEAMHELDKALNEMSENTTNGD